MSIRTLAFAATVCVALFVGLWAGVTAYLRSEPPEPARVRALTAVEPPLPWPEPAMTDLDGQPLGLPSGRPVLVNLWATWCAPCIRELPSLDRLAKSGTVVVVALSIDDKGAEAVRPFLAKLSLTNLTVALDPGMKSVAALGARGVPVTVLLDARGRIVARYEGGTEWDAPAMVEQIRGALGRAG